MWDDLQRFLDYLIRQYGISRVLLAPFATIGVLVGAGLVTGGTAGFVATGISLFIAVVFISALTLQLKATRQLLGQRARVGPGSSIDIPTVSRGASSPTRS